MSSKNFNSFKDFQSDQIQTSSRKLFTAHYACSNSDLNLTPVTGTTNGFIFQIINSLIESWGVRLTCFDCKEAIFIRLHPNNINRDSGIEIPEAWMPTIRQQENLSPPQRTAERSVSSSHNADSAFGSKPTSHGRGF